MLDADDRAPYIGLGSAGVFAWPIVVQFAVTGDHGRRPSRRYRRRHDWGRRDRLRDCLLLLLHDGFGLALVGLQCGLQLFQLGGHLVDACKQFGFTGLGVKRGAKQGGGDSGGKQ